MTIRPDLIARLRTTFALDWFGMHGAPYWSRVRPNGLKLAESAGAAPASSNCSPSCTTPGG